jgi:hypothetical protein
MCLQLLALLKLLRLLLPRWPLLLLADLPPPAALYALFLAGEGASRNLLCHG